MSTTGAWFLLLPETQLYMSYLKVVRRKSYGKLVLNHLSLSAEETIITNCRGEGMVVKGEISWTDTNLENVVLAS